MATASMATQNMENARAHSPEHRTVSRVMAILEAVIASEPTGLRLADLPDMIGAPKSTIHGLARGLVATGYLREHQGRYLPGPAVAMLAIGGGQVPVAYHHALERLSKTWNETAILATLAGESVINLEVVEPEQLIRAAPPVHERRPMWPGSYGKVFLAFMDPRRRDAYLRRKHKDPGEQARILAELETIRATGVAFNRGEISPDLYGVASPITVPGIDVTLAIGLAGPAPRMAERLDDIARSVLETASGLSNPRPGTG
jgi:DNA-binding IclR family transcriptional regulator